MWLIIGVSFSEWLMHRRRDSQSDLPTYGARPISLLLIFTAISLYAWFAINYRPPLAQLPVSNEVFVLQATDLFANEQTKYTETMFGDKQEPINFIIIARSDRQLSTVLLEAGWVLTDKADIPSLINSVKALILKSPYPSAPISPSFWNARIQDMSFAKVPGTNWLRNAHHLKIWKTNFLLENGNNIYVGLVNANDGFKWGIVPRVSPDLDSERESLHQDLSHTGKVDSFRKARLVKPQVGNNFMGDPFFSDGKVYIVSL
jgi:undecaprenyl-diphosphatase